MNSQKSVTQKDNLNRTDGNLIAKSSAPVEDNVTDSATNFNNDDLCEVDGAGTKNNGATTNADIGADIGTDKKVEEPTNVTTASKGVVKKSVSYLAKIAMLSAFGVVLLLIEFPLLPMVPHLQLNVSDVPALIATYMFGPISGVIVNSVKVGIGLLIRGTNTGFVGELSNLVSGALYVLVAGVIYLIKKDKLGAFISIVVSSLVFCAAMWICNQFFLLPMYGITDKAVMYPMLWWTLLFNVIKTGITGVITFLLYKRLRMLFNRF